MLKFFTRSSFKRWISTRGEDKGS